ncbi:hypothetical protein ARMGADRAFT_1030316 [Armillaria gallica]|uniref:Serine-threonine/tyrosine-protein kinase catalytic domain-containing protein n=1 Tax=Armillaria gallica TaxID=47427 RepID=A0A2H3DC47_ARMGA|nr:hypothetical protein ARMGADRAFT_1030316 [Armillaria gallica]
MEEPGFVSVTRFGAAPATPPTATADPGIVTVPRKQKSFWHAPLPMIPTLPLPKRRNRDNSVAPSITASNSADTTSISDSKYGCLSGGSATVWRKRLSSSSPLGGVPAAERPVALFSRDIDPSLYGWTQINLNDEGTDVRTQIQSLLRDVVHPWKTVGLLSPSAEAVVMDILQQELDDSSYPDEYRTVCMKCLRILSKTRNIVPSSLSCRDVIREGENPIWGGGFSDFCREALVWRQLQHPNVLPFLGVSEDLFAPSYCLISPWMVDGNSMAYLQAHPDHDRLTSLVQVAGAMKY